MTRVIYEPNIRRDLFGQGFRQKQLERRPQTGFDGGGWTRGAGQWAIISVCDTAIPTSLATITALANGRESDADVIEAVGNGQILAKQRGVYLATFSIQMGESLDGVGIYTLIDWDVGTMISNTGHERDAGYLVGSAAVGQEVYASVSGHKIVRLDEPDMEGTNLITAMAANDSGGALTTAYAELLVTKIADFDNPPETFQCPE